MVILRLLSLALREFAELSTQWRSPDWMQKGKSGFTFFVVVVVRVAQQYKALRCFGFGWKV